jgi:O-methyltransferase involved in polyketide biosynthesis
MLQSRFLVFICSVVFSMLLVDWIVTSAATPTATTAAACMQGVVNFVDARTQWFDYMVDSSLSYCNIHQVVCLAAGFDTRAYRSVLHLAGALHCCNCL